MKIQCEKCNKWTFYYVRVRRADGGIAEVCPDCAGDSEPVEDTFQRDVDYAMMPDDDIHG